MNALPAVRHCGAFFSRSTVCYRIAFDGTFSIQASHAV